MLLKLIGILWVNKTNKIMTRDHDWCSSQSRGVCVFVCVCVRERERERERESVTHGKKLFLALAQRIRVELSFFPRIIFHFLGSLRVHEYTHGVPVRVCAPRCVCAPQCAFARVCHDVCVSQSVSAWATVCQCVCVCVLVLLLLAELSARTQHSGSH